MEFKKLLKKSISILSLVAFALSINVNVNAVAAPHAIPSYSQRELPKFTTDFVSDGFVVSRNFRNPEYQVLKNLVELRNYFARCQNLLKVFYEENFYRCDFLVLQGGPLEGAISKKAFSAVSFSEPLLTKDLPKYIETIDKIDIAFVKKYRNQLSKMPIEAIKKDFCSFLDKVKTSRLISSEFIDEDVYTLNSLIIHGQSAKLILQLKWLQESQ